MTSSEQDTPPSQYQSLNAEDHAKLQEMLTEFYDAIGRKNRALAAGIAYDIVGQQVIEALLTENAALREIAEAVAKYTPAEVSVYGYDTYSDCPFCEEETELEPEHPGSPDRVLISTDRDNHTLDCPVTKARALVQSS